MRTKTYLAMNTVEVTVTNYCDEVDAGNSDAVAE
jgi:hypothetical protein